MKLFAMILAAAAIVSMTIPASAKGAKGLWMVRDGRAKVEVAPCSKEQADKLCGRIIWLHRDERKDAQGRPRSDAKNNNPAQRKRRIIGLPVAYDMVQVNATNWEGRVYDPEKGSSYMGYMKLLSDGRMKVTGCLAAFLCQSKYWKPLRK